MTVCREWGGCKTYQLFTAAQINVWCILIGGLVCVAANRPTGILCGGFCAFPNGLHRIIFGWFSRVTGNRDESPPWPQCIARTKTTIIETSKHHIYLFFCSRASWQGRAAPHPVHGLLPHIRITLRRHSVQILHLSLQRVFRHASIILAPTAQPEGAVALWKAVVTNVVPSPPGSCLCFLPSIGFNTAPSARRLCCNILSTLVFCESDFPPVSSPGYWQSRGRIEIWTCWTRSKGHPYRRAIFSKKHIFFLQNIFPRLAFPSFFSQICEI